MSVTSPLSLLPTILHSCAPHSSNAKKKNYELCIEVVEEEESGWRELFVRIRIKNPQFSLFPQFQKLNLTLPKKESASHHTAMELSKKTVEVIQEQHTPSVIGTW